MYGEGRSGRGRQWRRRAGCDAAQRGAGSGRMGGGGEGERLGGPTVTRTFLALASTAAQDLCDRDGVARPLLRRGALRLTTSVRSPARRLGAEYLRVDPPTPEEVARLAPLLRRSEASGIGRTAPASPIGDADVEQRILLPAPGTEEPPDPGDDETPDPTGGERPC